MPASTFTITYSKPGTVPPVYVAGSFSSPPWEPQELDPDGREESDSFSRNFSVDPGTYQYKFRLGTGDWWVVDDTQETVTDDQGNINNVLIVQESERISISAATPPAEPKQSAENPAKDTDSGNNLPRAGKPELRPAVPFSEISVQAEDGPANSSSQAISAAAAKVSPPRRHDLPTPPLSEGGDEVESKEAPAEVAEDDFPESDHLVQSSKRTREKKPSTVPAPKWSRNGMILLAVAVVVIPVVARSLSQ